MEPLGRRFLKPQGWVFLPLGQSQVPDALGASTAGPGEISWRLGEAAWKGVIYLRATSRFRSAHLKKDERYLAGLPSLKLTVRP